MPKPPLRSMMLACWLAATGWASGAQADGETEFLAAAPPTLSTQVLVDAGRETGPVDIPVQLTLSRPAHAGFMVPALSKATAPRRGSTSRP